jgi:hypothetical protein
VPEGSRSRSFEVAPQRFASWISSFGELHGELTARLDGEAAVFLASDGSQAQCLIPFPPLADTGGSATEVAERIAAHASDDRTVGVLLVRRGGYAAGVFTGSDPSLAASKVGSRLVHGRSAAGGQSQQRFARRRENQARQAMTAAADTAAAVFAPFTLDALVLGGDRRALAAVRTDARLEPYFERAVDRFLTVPDPRLAVLQSTPRLFRAIRVTSYQGG